VPDAIVLAGGAATRLGGAAKPQLPLAGRSLLDHVLTAVPTAARVVVVGPEQPVDREVVFCREHPVGGGPVAAIAAGLPHVAADVVIVLAADLPFVAPAIPRLLAALPPAGAALLVDPAGRVNHLAAAWRRTTLELALAAVGDPVGAPARALIEHVPHVLVTDEEGWGRDVDTWDDLAQLRSEREEPDA
jgi:molybdopterin-guanine dinucleotide biosynthesis protein A